MVVYTSRHYESIVRVHKLYEKYNETVSNSPLPTGPTKFQSQIIDQVPFRNPSIDGAGKWKRHSPLFNFRFPINPHQLHLICVDVLEHSHPVPSFFSKKQTRTGRMQASLEKMPSNECTFH